MKLLLLVTIRIRARWAEQHDVLGAVDEDEAQAGDLAVLGATRSWEGSISAEFPCER